MIATEKTSITVTTFVNAPTENVWACWTRPEHIVRWNHASPDWHTPAAENDLREGGRFTYRMEARYGSVGFDFGGTYTKVEHPKEIAYALDDGRKVSVCFSEDGAGTTIVQTFEAENVHPEELQRTGWQAILDNFKQYAEARGKTKCLHFEVSVDAPAEKVYKTMLDPQGYREWTAEFCPTSYYEGSWVKGAKIRFVGENKEGKREGMVSRIKENVPNEFVSIEHLGVLDGETEITTGPAVESWAGALENYRFRTDDGRTVVSVSMDANEQFTSYFEQAWPKALQKLKAICEK